MRIVWPFRSPSVTRGCSQVDSRLDTAKICSNRRVDADRPRLRAVFGGGKTFLHSLGQKLTWACSDGSSVFSPTTDIETASDGRAETDDERQVASRESS